MSKLEEDWFNNYSRADIFQSHSHKNGDLAIVFAGWLEGKV